MRDHGGRISDAIAEYGGSFGDWLDLSTGINPTPYPIGKLSDDLWARLPDPAAENRLIEAARSFWNIPDDCAVLAAGGASALIAALPGLRPPDRVQIARETYNEHEAAFAAAGWQINRDNAPARVIVRPNNPDGLIDPLPAPLPDLLVIDESFADVTPDQSLVAHATDLGVIILKSFGKFWGLAGLRLGFAIGHPAEISKLRDRIGPWPVSGPALEIATRALGDHVWAVETRAQLSNAAKRLDQIVEPISTAPAQGTDLFRLITCENALDMHQHLSRHHILTRIFPYNRNWLRLGLPGTEVDWSRLESALSHLK